VAALMKLAPDRVRINCVKGVEVEVDPADGRPGWTRVSCGPASASASTGASSARRSTEVDQAPITGESVPVVKTPG
jgi:cation transport ATPase